MEVIKEGTYPEKNTMICKECGCEFKYYDSEIIKQNNLAVCDLLDDASILSVREVIECPTCGAYCVIRYILEKDESLFDRLFEKVTKGGKHSGKH